MVDIPADYTDPSAQRGLGLQLLIALSIAMSSIVVFSGWRRSWPRIYAARAMRRSELPKLDKTWFGWMKTLYNTTDRQVLDSAGLDAFVYLKFFEAAIALLWRLATVSLFVIGPLRWWYLGKYGDDGPEDPENPPELSYYGWAQIIASSKDDSSKPPSLFGDYKWVYLVFTYVFTLISLHVLRRYTNDVVTVRQEYLGHQNSITDRTLRITGIPKLMRSEGALSSYLTRLFGTDPHSIVLCHNWSKLDHLSNVRYRLLRHLERLWGTIVEANRNASGDSSMLQTPDEFAEVSDGSLTDRQSSRNQQSLAFQKKRRPMGRVGFLGLFGPQVDLIDFYTVKLASLDEEIKYQREIAGEMPVMPTAFVTMKSVADCQMAAQALLSPKPHTMISSLAPSPHDVIWENIYLPPKRKSVQSYGITAVVLLTGAFIALPLTYLASLLDMETIEKLAPRLANLLKDHEWLQAFVIEVLPTFLYTFLNMVIPYLFAYLSTWQGYVSREELELSLLSKNFFYVFVNLYLVFTVSSTYLSTRVLDTAEIARGFANSLRRLSTFYTNLIVLQGIGLTPLRLLQASSVMQYPFSAANCKSARDKHDLYKPSTLNYGILLPTPLLIFIVVLVYSIIRKRIVFFGTIYFIFGYYVYKYQFLYSMVHTQHSNGRLWTFIMRRVYVGIGLFHLAMCGTLVIQAQYTYALLILPLTGILVAVWYDFEKFTEPLLRFIAIEAVNQSDETILDFTDDIDIRSNVVEAVPRGYSGADSGDLSFGSNVWASSTILDEESGPQNEDVAPYSETTPTQTIRHRQSRTLDEDRELHVRYVNQNLIAPLDGPWVATDGNYKILAQSERGDFVKKPLSYEEWD